MPILTWENRIMFHKVMLSTLGLLAAFTGPIAYFSVSEYWKGGRTATATARTAGSTTQTTALQKSDPSAPAVSPLPAGSAAAPTQATLEGSPVRSLDEIFRFDVTADWIMHRWPRVSTGLAQLPLQGYRVPLVTGTAETDLAGSLTYYFNAQQQAQRIAFRGSTGDPRELVALVTSRYHMVRRLTNDPGLMVYEGVRANGRPANGLRIHAAPIVKSSEPYQRFDVELVLERPEE
jgi:hypothetical protein